MGCTRWIAIALSGNLDGLPSRSAIVKRERSGRTNIQSESHSICLVRHIAGIVGNRRRLRCIFDTIYTIKTKIYGPGVG